MNYKLIVVGDTSVGKTSLVHRYVFDEFKEFNAPTIITSFIKKKFNNYIIDIWDSAG